MRLMSDYWAKLGLTPPKRITCRNCRRDMPNPIAQITQRDIDEGEEVPGVSAPLCAPCLTNKLEAMGVLKSWQKRNRINRLNRVKMEGEDEHVAKLRERGKIPHGRQGLPKPRTTPIVEKNINSNDENTSKNSKRDIKMTLGSFLK